MLELDALDARGARATEAFRRRLSWLPYVGLAATLGLANVLEWHERNVTVLRFTQERSS